MGRPTIEKKDKTVKLRLSDEMYTELIKRGENVSETIRGMIRDSVNNVTSDGLEEIDRECNRLGLDRSAVLRYFSKMLAKIDKQ